MLNINEPRFPLVTVVVTCKNRLAHLKQTLPKLCSQNLLEVVVVDYGCNEGTGAWVKHNYPTVKLVCVEGDPVFSASKARNIGARIATGEFIMFADADIIIDFSINDWVKNNLKQNQFCTIQSKRDYSLCGTVIVYKSDFHKVGEYDEVFTGWGGEDLELYQRLENHLIERKYIDDKHISAIQHGDDIRQLSVEQGGSGSKRMTLSIIKLYTNIIADLYKNKKVLNFNDRSAIMEKIKNFITVGERQTGQSIFKITVADKNGKTPEITLSYKINFPLNGINLNAKEILNRIKRKIQ